MNSNNKTFVIDQDNKINEDENNRIEAIMFKDSFKENPKKLSIKNLEIVPEDINLSPNPGNHTSKNLDAGKIVLP